MSLDTLKNNPVTKLWYDSFAVEKALLNKICDEIERNKLSIKELSEISNIAKKRLKKILNREISPNLDEFLVLIFIFDMKIGVK